MRKAVALQKLAADSLKVSSLKHIGAGFRVTLLVHCWDKCWFRMRDVMKFLESTADPWKVSSKLKHIGTDSMSHIPRSLFRQMLFQDAGRYEILGIDRGSLESFVQIKTYLDRFRAPNIAESAKPCDCASFPPRVGVSWRRFSGARAVQAAPTFWALLGWGCSWHVTSAPGKETSPPTGLGGSGRPTAQPATGCPPRCCRISRSSRRWRAPAEQSLKRRPRHKRRRYTVLGQG